LFASFLGLHHNVTLVDKDLQHSQPLKPVEVGEISRVLLPKEHPIDPINSSPLLEVSPIPSIDQPKNKFLVQDEKGLSVHQVGDSMNLGSHLKKTNSTNGRQDLFHMALAAAPPRGEVSLSSIKIL